ncbi:peptide-methionine (S)-S-oxide reductase MsrA [Bordetella petrii]|uniref:Peptide methionine sulfoxide reductase MsrA n=1 Tax=Bordetella petrii (strain ATCC BAA-461 / DSM 12804 / CCUG 43448 / CIP 107267 / Se-1111R) TaxID=340100 RepID=A9INB1_BORPD|nr:peptide-methionine (S)-S-oxide reductase MsrA [Bordetella petrii]CAP42813.1 msrA2 [Bordetella petrii]
MNSTRATPAAKSGFLSRRASFRLAGAALLAGAAWFTFQTPGRAAEAVYRIPPPAMDLPAGDAHTATAVLAGGCFWGVQAVFQHVQGVTQALSGYAGGNAGSANYDTVSSGRTGHAEAVQITYDPTRVSYGQLLQIYFSVAHDPTQHNRQGPDVGTQYRSAIFPASDDQRKVAEAYIAQLNRSGIYPKPLATTVENLQGFYPAENYHQDYLAHHPDSLYIVINDQPKIENLAKEYPARFRQTPVLVGG